MALKGDLTRRIGNIICGDRRVVGDLLYDERGHPTPILVWPMTVEEPKIKVPDSVIPQQGVW
jgi:hypothetical protein